MRIREIIISISLCTGAVAPLMGKIPAGLKGFNETVGPFLKKNCIDCHNAKKKKGKVVLHDLSGDLSSGKGLERWEDVLDMVESGEMPPEDKPQPSESERKAIVEWIEAALREQSSKPAEEKPQPITRRLTNFEYQNTMRDLLGFELDLMKDLPLDPDKPYHFNNNAEMMLIGSDQLVRYKEAALKAMKSAIVDPAKPKIHRTTAKWEHGKPGKGGLTKAEIGVYKGPSVDSKAVDLKSWPETGEFKIRIKASGNLSGGSKEVPLHIVMGTILKHDSGSGNYKNIGVIHLNESPKNPGVHELRGRIENIPIQPSRRVKSKVKPPSITITAQNIFDNGQLNDHRKSGFDASWASVAPRVVLHSLEFEAPVTEVWPPAHHTRILFDSPLKKTNKSKYVYKVIERFMSRAFRRPVSKSEVEHYLRIYKIYETECDTFEQSIRETLAMVLISPQFLYHTVIDNASAIKSFELASRLSYFLWGSMPDKELFALAASGKLNDTAVIESQARRMLADPKAEDFVENFTKQWLSIDKMKTVSINRELFPRFLYTVHIGERSGQEQLFRPTIRDYMLEETVGFVRELLKKNESIMNVVDSNFAYLNEPLAVHYGVEGVQGLRFRRVPITPKHRMGGLLTHGSVLIGNSTGSAPHPIYRAVWLREAILGDEVKPPPADVPALSDTAGESAEESSSIKDLLALHRTKESCADCHVRLDPWGIPFERYNAIGKFQPFNPKEGAKIRGFNLKKDKDLSGYEKYLASVYKIKVDASSRLPNGPSVDGMLTLKKYLLQDRKDEISENIIRRLLTYGIGRKLTYRDRFQVDLLMEQAKKRNYKFQDMIVSVCKNPTFTGNKTK